MCVQLTDTSSEIVCLYLLREHTEVLCHQNDRKAAQHIWVNALCTLDVPYV